MYNLWSFILTINHDIYHEDDDGDDLEEFP